MDIFDKNILTYLQENGRASNTQIAEAVHLTESPCWRRTKNLEEQGVISSYTALLDKQKLGYGFQAIVNLSVDVHTSEATKQFVRELCAFPEVLALYNITGEYDLAMFVVAKDIESYSQFVEHALGKFTSIKKISTNVVLQTLKETTHLPLDLV